MIGLINNNYHVTREAKHFNIDFNGFGIGEEILYMLSENGVDRIFIEYNGEQGKIIYHSPLSLWLESDKKLTEGEYVQRFLSLPEMIKIGVDKDV